MSTTVQCKELSAGAKLVAPAAASKTSLPIISHMLVKSDKATGRISLHATDLETWVSHELPNAQLSIDEKPVLAAVPARLAFKTLHALGTSEMSLTSERDGKDTSILHLQGKRSAFHLNGLNPVEFPALPEIKGLSFSIKASVLAEAFQFVVPALSTDFARPILCAVYIECIGDRLRIVATDTHRLAIYGSEETDELPDFKATIRIAAIQRLRSALSLLKDVDASVSIILSADHIRFSIKDDLVGCFLITGMQVAGSYPAFDRVIPTFYNDEVVIDRLQFITALRRSLLFASQGSANRVVITPGKESLTVSTHAHIGDASEEIDAEIRCSKKPFQIAFNAKYLIDALNSFNTERVTLQTSEPLRPGVIIAEGRCDPKVVLMPMQVV